MRETIHDQGIHLGGHFTTAVQDHASPDFTTRTTGTSADMTKTVFAGMETSQNPMGRSAQIRGSSTTSHFRWLFWGRERPQRAAITAQSVLNSSECVSTVVDNLPVVVTGKSIWEMLVRIYGDSRGHGGPPVFGATHRPPAFAEGLQGEDAKGIPAFLRHSSSNGAFWGKGHPDQQYRLTALQVARLWRIRRWKVQFSAHLC